MYNSRMEQFDKAVKLRTKSAETIMDYWINNSLYSSFEYWLLVAFLLAPLVILFFKIDKCKIFLICFYGYSVHMLSLYTNVIGINRGLWNYPFPIIPDLPSIAFDSSLVPITYMFMYQWTLNQKRNYYLTAILLAMFFAFLFEPLLIQMDLFKMYGKINYIHRFFVYVLIAMLAKFITNIFLKMNKTILNLLNPS